MTVPRPFLLVILDGWGAGPSYPGNAIERANTPVMDRLYRDYPHTTLGASGVDVGLPPGQMGVASGMLATMRNLGMVVGTALAGAVWTGRMAFHAERLAQSGLLDAQALAVQSFVGGFQDAFRVSAAISLIGVFTSLVRGSQARNR